MGLTWRESLRDVLSSAGEQIGRIRRPVDVAADYYAHAPGYDVGGNPDEFGKAPIHIPDVVAAVKDVLGSTEPGPTNEVLSEGLVPVPPTAGELVKEAVYPDEEAKKSYVDSVAREVAGFGADLATDPLTYALGAGGKFGKAAGVGFTGLMAKGAVESGLGAVEKYQEKGFTPEVAGEATKAALEGSGAYLGAKHLFAGHEVPPVETDVKPHEVPPVEAPRVQEQPVQGGPTVDLANQVPGVEPPVERPIERPLPEVTDHPSGAPFDQAEGPRQHDVVNFLSQNKHWHDFSDWYRKAMDVTKKAIIGLPQDVLPPRTHMRGSIQSVAETPLGGATLSPYLHAFNRLGLRTVPGYPEMSRPYSSGIFFNPISHLMGMARDARDYPSFREVMQDPRKRFEDFLRRTLETQAHELVHSTGATHPLKDAGVGPVVFDERTGKPPKAFMDSERIRNSESGATGDHRFATILEHTLRNYESGAFDNLMKEAEPHVEHWFTTLLDANEIAEGRTPPDRAIPPPEPGQPGPVEGDPTTGGGTGLPPTGLPGGPRTPGGPPNPPTGGGRGTGPEGGPGAPGGPPPKLPKVKIDFSKLPGHGIKEFINRRAAARTHARALRFNLKDLANEGMDWVKNFEKDPTSVPGGDRVKKIFDEMLAEEKRYGVPVRERRNYIYHLWEEDPETVRRTFRRLGVRPGFTQERIYETYEEGIKAGLTPKYDNPVDIIAERMRQHKKLIADKGFYNALRATKNIKPITKAPKDWIEVRNFPFHRYTTGKYEHVQPWAAPAPIAERLNRYLDSPISSPMRDFWQKAAGVATDIKNVVMSSGIPGTSFNAHGFNIARRIAATKDSTWGSLMKTVKTPFDLLSKGKAEEKWLTEHLPEAAKFQEAGMIFNIEDHPFKVVEGETVPKAKKPFWEEVKGAYDSREGTISKNYGALRKMHELLFEDPLFQRALPAWKLKFAIEEEGKLLKAGLEPKEATHVAAHNANNIFGGINWVEEGRDPQFQTFLRLAMNAPDWAETNLRVGKGVVKGVFNPKDPRFQVYRNVIRNVAVYYLITNAISRMFKGNEEYPSERHFQVRAGKAASGRTRYLKPAGTAEDWVRLPYEITTKLAQGDLSGVADVVSARVHPMTQGLLNVVRNRNYWGRELTGPKLPVLTQVGRLAHEVTDVAAPAYVKAPVAALAGEAGPEEALLKSVEAPVAYARPQPGSVGPAGRQPRSRYSRPARSGR